MNLKLIFLGTLAYTLVTFPLAIMWHIVLFEESYQVFGYIEDEPNFVLGFLSIFLQGALLSALYPYVTFCGSAIVRGLKFSLALGVFFWTSHVLAFVAKQIVTNPLSFVAMESFYLLLQFGIYGVLIGLIYRNVERLSQDC